MKENILKKIVNLWNNKILDTTKEWEEGISEEVELSKYSVIVKSDLVNRIKFLFSNKLTYRLTSHQSKIIRKNPLKEE